MKHVKQNELKETMKIRRRHRKNFTKKTQEKLNVITK